MQKAQYEIYKINDDVTTVTKQAWQNYTLHTQVPRRPNQVATRYSRALN